MEKDMIKNPAHYTEGRKYEPKDVIRDWGLNFNLGNVVKYIARAGRKDELVQDLKKAQQYLQFEIDALKCGEEPKILSVNDLAGMTVREFVRRLEAKKIVLGMTIQSGDSKKAYALERVDYSPYLCLGSNKIRLRLRELVFAGEEPKDFPGTVEIVLTQGRERKCEW